MLINSPPTLWTPPTHSATLQQPHSFVNSLLIHRLVACPCITVPVLFQSRQASLVLITSPHCCPSSPPCICSLSLLLITAPHHCSSSLLLPRSLIRLTIPSLRLHVVLFLFASSCPFCSSFLPAPLSHSGLPSFSPTHFQPTPCTAISERFSYLHFFAVLYHCLPPTI
jgi:hypothetical protein